MEMEPCATEDLFGVNLHWPGHQEALVSLMQDLRSQEKFLDVTLVADGQHINVHRFPLMAHSLYFRVSIYSI